MALVRFQPFADDFHALQERIHRIFQDTALSRVGDEAMGAWAPSCDIYEEGDSIIVKAELPEVKKEDVKVTVENGVLTLQGERKQEKEEKGKKFHRIERSYGSFLRTFTVPLDTDETRVAADFKDGILKIRLPKTEKPRPKAIDVRVS